MASNLFYAEHSFHIIFMNKRMKMNATQVFWRVVVSIKNHVSSKIEMQLHRKALRLYILNKIILIYRSTGTHKLHSVTPISRYEVAVKDFSYSTVARKEKTTSTVVVSVPFDAIRGFVIAVYDMKWYLACVLATYPDSREL